MKGLAAFLADQGLPGGEPVLIEGGKSNLTYQVGDLIVRRPPLGHVLRTAHDMAREARVLSALRPTDVPVPKVLATCSDPSVIGAPFYVMERVPGTVYRDPADAVGLGFDALTASLVEVLTTLHAVDPASVGLADFGRPEGYLERQVGRWRKQLDASLNRPLPGIIELHECLARELPAVPGPSGIVHGDYKLDNLIISPGGGVAAVLDWEMATLGDQLTDLGLLLAYWEQMGSDAFPSGDALVDLYGADPSRLRWYRAFAYFKLSVIAEGIHFRYAAGQTVGDGFADMGAKVPGLVSRGHEILMEG